MFACESCKKNRYEKKCRLRSVLVCDDCTEAHFEELKVKKLRINGHIFDNADLLLSENNRKKLNVALEERLKLLT